MIIIRLTGYARSVTNSWILFSSLLEKTIKALELRVLALT
jgi:hypothetical protein